MDFRIIKSPSQSTKDILIRRIGGNCKTKLVLIGIFGDTSSVESAINEIKLKMKEGKTI